MKKRTFIKKVALSALGCSVLPYRSFPENRFSSNKIPIIDTHLHLWDLKKMEYPWLKDPKSPLSRNFLLPDFQEASKDFPIRKMVFVECARLPEQYLEEVDWVSQQARKDERIRGMVAYFPLEKGKKALPELEEMTQRDIVRGIRKGVSQELMNDSSFLGGVKLLSDYDLSYDLNITPVQMKESKSFVRKFPDITFILNHICNPQIVDQEMDQWKKDILEFGKMENVVCKISGVITKADPQKWKIEDLKPYVLHVLEAFPSDRVVFGGDWPVVLRAGSYSDWMNAFFQLTEQLSGDEKEALYYRNAERIYRI